MIKLLVVLGVIFIGLAFWKGRAQAVSRQQELLEMKQIRDELREAKKEVGCLMSQLEEVSEKIVEEISLKVSEAKNLKVKAEPVNSPGAGINDSAGAGFSEESAEDCSGDFAEEIVGDFEDDSEGAMKTNRSSGREGSEAEEKLRKSLAFMKENVRINGTGSGKTVPFPLSKDYFFQKSAGVRSEPARELPPKHQMVYAMAKLGYSEAEIAQQMQIGKGEVNLMLRLKRKGEEANA